MIIKIFKGLDKENQYIDTDWTLRKCFNQLNQQKYISSSLTGGRTIIVSWFKTGFLLNAESGLIFYDIEFDERKEDAKIIKIELCYSTRFEEVNGLKDNEVLFER